MSPIFPDCYDEWELVQVSREDDWVRYETIFEGTQEDCIEYARDNFTVEEQNSLVLMDWEGREYLV
jgi:hypothetical protein